MFHSPRSEAKQRSDSNRTQTQQSPDVSARAPFGYAPVCSQLARLHSTYGNQAVLRMLSQSAPAIQTRLAVNKPGDEFEQEADRVADQVMRMTAPSIQRKCSGCEEEDKVQRKCAGCEEEEKQTGLQRKEAGAGPQFAPPSVHSVLNSAGRPLDPATRAFMEPRFGHDFSGVRVHTDASSAESAKAINAVAYTAGENIVFGTGKYEPASDSGRRLLAHELAHTVQQGKNSVSNLCVARQCDPAWAGLTWTQRVNNVNNMPSGAKRNQCKTDMIQEALGGMVTVNESTNSSPTTAAAVKTGQYTELGSPAKINFDQNLNAKTNSALFGDTSFQPSSSGGLVQVYVVLGPKALNTVGPEFTRKAYQHEQEHADAFIMQDVTGAKVHRATPGEELSIYTLNFTSYFTDVWTINNTPPCGFSLADDFPALLANYEKATPAEQNNAFTSLSNFFNLWVTPIPCNTMKFRIWLQSMLNANPNSSLVKRLNGLPGMSLTQGTKPGSWLICPTPCP